MLHVDKGEAPLAGESNADFTELKQFPSSCTTPSVSADNGCVTTTCSSCAKNKSEPKTNADSDNETETLEDFASATTMHGVSFYYSSRSKPMKVFWIFLLVGMVSMLIYQLVDRIVVYFQYETNTSITQEFVTELSFPAVTICTFNRFYVNTTGDERLLNAIHAVNQLITPENVAINEILEQKLNLTDISENLGEPLDVKHLLRKYGFSLDVSTMHQCIHKYESCTPDDFSQILTWMGACYTFNNGNVSKIQSIPGAGHGFSATIDVKKHLNTEEPILGLVDLGLRVQIHQRGDTPDVSSLGISIPVGMKASIEVFRDDYDLMYRPWGRCNPSRENLVYFDVYTFRNCLQECYTNALLEHCGCYLFTQYWAEGFGRECTAEEMQECASQYLIEIEQNVSIFSSCIVAPAYSIKANYHEVHDDLLKPTRRLVQYSAETCGCSVPCSSTEYNTAVSYSTFPNPPTTKYLKDNLGYSEDEVYGNAVEFDVYYKSMSYTKFSQTKKVSESGLLSDMGGQLGLWLGMSIITAVEIAQFCAKKMCGSRKKETM